MNFNFLDEDDLNIESLVDILKQASYVPYVARQDTIVVDINGRKVSLMIIEELKLIRFVCVFSFKENSSFDSILRLIGDLNRYATLVKFVSSEEDYSKLVCEYYINYKGGLIDTHLPYLVDIFGSVCFGSISEYDIEGIIN